MESIPQIGPAQADALGYYVYVFYDALTKAPFYIGKGKGARLLSHIKSGHNPEVTNRLSEGNYDFDFLAYGLDEETALKVEAAAIDLIGIDQLLNATRGQGALKYGRMNARMLINRLRDEPLTEIRHNIVAVSIKDTYERYGDTEEALYESTRGVWALSLEGAQETEYVVGIVGGRIVYVMSVAAVLPAGSTNYFLRQGDYSDSNRIEFVGRTAETDIRDTYLGRGLKANQQATYYGPFAGRVHLTDEGWQGSRPE